MINQGEHHPSQEPKLNPEQVEKTDKDLATLSTLSIYAASNGSILEISGGYAVEAHFGGRISRPHGDIDAVLWLSNASAEETAKQEVADILFHEPTPWAEFPNVKSRQHFIEFREVAPEKPFLDSRRVELYIFDRKGMRPLVEKSLRDSKGKEHKVMVTTLEEIVADKVRILTRTDEEKQNKRATRQTDVDEFKRIISHKDFSKDKYLLAMAGALVYRSNGELTLEQAFAIAEEKWNHTIQVIDSYSQHS